MQNELGRNTVVLLGIGHTNAHVLRMWKMNPLPDSQLVCVSNFPVATYSGMMPGVLAGQYSVQQMEIDLVRLCASVGARLILGEVEGLDAQHRELHFHDRPSLAFDVLSIGVGSRPSFEGVDVQDRSSLVAIKPMQTFLARLRDRFETLRRTSIKPQIAVVGGGTGSIEIAFCLDQRIRQDPDALGLDPGSKYEIVLVTGSEEVGSGLEPNAKKHVLRELERRGIGTRTGARVRAIEAERLQFQGTESLDCNLVIWATSATAPPLLDQLGLPTDAHGFLKTRPTLQSVAHDHIFAVGDSGSIDGLALPKAGVYAVRQGPVLWNNLRRQIWKRKPLNYHPQGRFLKLINTADGKAISEYGRASFHHALAWRLKDRIDTKFMRMYQDYSMMPVPAPGARATQQADAMRCLGCGGKVGSKMLGDVLRELKLPTHPDVIIGLDQPDDAAVLAGSSEPLTVTTDFFASPMDDPYLVGRIALLNSASDCWVMGAEVTAALAMIELPFGHPRAQRQVMRECLAGAVEELARADAALVGGHTIEGPRLTIGFTVLGRQQLGPKTKGLLRPGDRLILTKPIGTGVLLAALMQGRLPGHDYQSLVDSMLQSNRIAIELMKRFDIAAVTDVTGFGFAGHLAEMLLASQQSATIEMESIPQLPGCLELIEAGIESTLAPDNRNVAERIEIDNRSRSALPVASLFDPQTGGGMLIGVAASRSHEVVQFLHDHGFGRAAEVGQVEAMAKTAPVMRWV